MSVPYVSRVIAAHRMDDPEYRGRMLFDLFVALHRQHDLQPDADKPYMIVRSVENWDVRVSMLITDVLPEVAPGTKALFLDRQTVEGWVSRLSQVPS